MATNDNSFSTAAGLWQDGRVQQKADIRTEDWARPGEPFRLTAVRADAADWAACLPAEARSRLERHADDQARARAGASEWLKTCWLPRELGMERVAFGLGANGKPLPGGEASGWGFNLSHAGDWVVAGLVRGAGIGVDLETTARRTDIGGLSKRVFSDSEQAQVREGGREAFFTLWSQKEALLKALGCGWADGRIQRRTALVTDGFQVEPATGARVWSRRVKGREYALAVALLDQSENTSAVNT